jgi:hypothetical protein
MTLPDTDDLLLFGSLAMVAIGVLLVVASLSGHLALAVGAGLITFGLPSFLVTFMAAGEPE